MHGRSGNGSGISSPGVLLARLVALARIAGSDVLLDRSGESIPREASLDCLERLVAAKVSSRDCIMAFCEDASAESRIVGHTEATIVEQQPSQYFAAGRWSSKEGGVCSICCRCFANVCCESRCDACQRDDG